MSANHATLTAADITWAAETALSSHQHRWVERQITGAASRDAAIDATRHILTTWGTFNSDGRVAGQPFAPPGQLTVERHGHSGFVSVAELVDAVRSGPAWQEALF
jgi:hypothetical protein